MDSESATAIALEAIRLCQRGDQAAGVARYRDALVATGGHALPVGLHVALLAGSGYAAAADLIRKAGMLRGVDLSTCGWIRGGSAAAAVTEYQMLLEQGIGTASMIERYMNALSFVGDAHTLAQLAAPGTLFRQTVLPDALLRRVTDLSAALTQAPGRRFEQQRRSVRGMDRVPDTHRLADERVVELHSVVRTLIAAYLGDVAASGHVIAQWLPRDFSLQSWCVISDGSGGYNAPHTHAGCWTVAVVYVEGQPASRSGRDEPGMLRIGPSPGGNAQCGGWPDLAVAPTPGTVVIMPGFYTHWTVPVSGGGTRISVAFNVVNRLDQNDPNAVLNDAPSEIDDANSTRVSYRASGDHPK